MSHVELREPMSEGEEIRDLGALARAVERCGGAYLADKKTFHTWATDHGALAGDYPVPSGYTAAEITAGQCLAAIGVSPEVKKHGGRMSQYEIGVVASRKKPGTFALLYDFYGGALEQQFGNKLDKLLMFYQAEVARTQADLLGDKYSEQILPDGTLIIETDTTLRMGV